MRASDRPSRADRGFTLIEVMIAMVLLAVGLLALAGLGTVAVRSIGWADRGTRAAAVATLWLEDGLSILRRVDGDGVAVWRPVPIDCTMPNGDRIVRTVDVATDPSLPAVTVTVTPEPRGGTPRPYTISSSLFVPFPMFSEVAGDSPC